MAKINVLSFAVANLIAAGEVVDRPASVIKELMENAIDAGAKHITVEIQHGGVTFMRVADDGCGIDPEDLPVAIRRHATSKIKEADDLDGILTLGFRGEALAAIAAVSDLRIITRTKDAEYGTMLVSSAGEVKEIVEQGAPIGTTVIVENLFANVPARRKFLKKDVAETTAVTTYVEKIALSRPEIAIRLIVDGNLRLDTAGDGTLESAMYAVFGREFVKKMIPVKSMEGDAIAVDGYICRPDNARPKRNYQNFFINGRYINSRTASAALEQAYTSFIAPEKFPCCVLNIKIAPEAVDVNVHPAKLEVKFSNEKPVFEAVYYTVRAALEANSARPDMTLVKNASVPHPVHAFVPVEAPKTEQTTIDTVVKQVPRIEPFERLSATDYKDRVRGYAANAPTPYTRVEPARGEAIPMPNLERAAASVAPKDPIAKAAIARMEQENTAHPLPPETPAEPVAAPVRVTEPTPVEEVITVAPWRIIGEAFHCYVIVEQGDKLLLIDKHAAHERVLFEELKKKLKAHKTSSQMMMLPIEMTLSAADISTLEEYRAELEKIGFGFSAHGNTALINEIPAELSAAAASAFLGALAADLGSGTADVTLARDLLFEKALYQAACKAAIKGGREYPPEYIEELVKKLFEIPDITVCPHGRPVAMTLSHANIDRQFKRS
ncbi:MAG: DNA mismatch repair endonuclease MutL [Ruminococcaceae bacterium]|nr:DNA mismatch repair endonuclease MutL [Oscillospiraceae bacterium]